MPPSTAATPLVFGPRTVIIGSLVVAAVVAAAGSLSDISLGDENVHLRCVQATMAEGYRVPADPLFDDGRGRPIAFPATPLWHAGLALLWSVAGTHQALAQAYQAGFLVLLALSVYFASRRLWGGSAATWAWLVAVTMPMTIAFSVLLYQGVPGMAVAALSLMLLWRQRFLWAGICLALAYLVKMNMLVFVPWAAVVAVLAADGSWKRRLGAAAMVALPSVAVTAGDFYWRYTVYDALMGYTWTPPEELAPLLQARPEDYVIHRMFTLGQPLTLLSHLGVLIPAGAAVAMVTARDRPSRWLWLGFAVTLAGSLYVFHHNLQMRYLSPVVLVLVFLAGRGLAGVRLSKPWKVALVVLAGLQVAPALYYVHQQRRIAPPEQAAYRWIRQHTPPGTQIMSPEMRLTVQTDRPMIWGNLNPAWLMAEATPAQRRQVMDYFDVDYIAVPRRRIFDPDEQGIHDWGYPRPFLDELDRSPGARRVFANESYMIYRLERTPAKGSAAAPHPPPADRNEQVGLAGAPPAAISGTVPPSMTFGPEAAARPQGADL